MILRTLTVDQRARSYWVHVPEARDPATPWPVVLALHGGASNGRAMSDYCGLNRNGDEAGFVVVYPNGTGQRENLLTWNAGNCCGWARENQVDDVKFVLAALDDVNEVVQVDPQRIFATGMSNGAMLAYRLAAEHADRFAAIAPVAGPMAIDGCAPARPVSVLHIHGTNDQFTPFDGGRGKRSVTGTVHASIPQTISAWVTANGCSPQPEVAQLPIVVDDGTRVTRSIYGGGRSDSEVVLYAIEGGGHTWPGRRSNTFIFGKSSGNLNANDVIWDFFERHGS